MVVELGKVEAGWEGGSTFVSVKPLDISVSSTCRFNIHKQDTVGFLGNKKLISLIGRQDESIRVCGNKKQTFLVSSKPKPSV